MTRQPYTYKEPTSVPRGAVRPSQSHRETVDTTRRWADGQPKQIREVPRLPAAGQESQDREYETGNQKDKRQAMRTLSSTASEKECQTGFSETVSSLIKAGIDATIAEEALDHGAANIVIQQLLDTLEDVRGANEAMKAEMSRHVRARKALEEQLLQATRKRPASSPPPQYHDAQPQKRQREDSQRMQTSRLPYEDVVAPDGDKLTDRTDGKGHPEQGLMSGRVERHSGPSVASSQYRSKQLEPPYPLKRKKNYAALLGPIEYGLPPPKRAEPTRLLDRTQEDIDRHISPPADDGASGSESLEPELTEPDESQHDKTAREGRNKKKARKKANLNAQAAEKAEIKAMSRPGRVPDIIGVKRINDELERDNSFLNMLSPTVYVARNNVVFAGKSAVAAATYEMTHAEAYSERVMKGQLYRKAPRGFPMNPYELKRMVRFVNDKYERMEERIEAAILLIEFHSMSRVFAPECRDRTMEAILDDEVYSNVITLPLPREDEQWRFKAMPCSRDLFPYKEDHATHGAGIPHPAPDQGFNIDAWARYILLHGRPGGPNSFVGVAMDFAYRVDRRCVFGSLLVRHLGPISTQGRTIFVRHFASIVARPGLYRERVASWNRDNPSKPFVPHSASGAITLERLNVHFSVVANMTEEDVIQVLIKNRIPVEWVDHAYPYGVQYIRHHLMTNGEHRQLMTEINAQRAVRLNDHGEPGEIEAWGGWFWPTVADLSRLQELMMLERQKDFYSLTHPGWLKVGERAVTYGLPCPSGAVTPLMAASTDDDVALADMPFFEPDMDQPMIEAAKTTNTAGISSPTWDDMVNAEIGALSEGIDFEDDTYSA